MANAPEIPLASPQPTSLGRAIPGISASAGNSTRSPLACDHTTTASVELRREASPPQKSAAP